MGTFPHMIIHIHLRRYAGKLQKSFRIKKAKAVQESFRQFNKYRAIDEIVEEKIGIKKTVKKIMRALIRKEFA